MNPILNTLPQFAVKIAAQIKFSHPKLSHLKLSGLALCCLAFAGSLAAAESVIVQPGDTAYSLARRAGLSVDQLLLLNNLSTPDLKIGQTVNLSSNPPHTVQSGETLYAIAHKYGVTVDALKAANTLPQDATIAVGQVLQIPGAMVAGAEVAPAVAVAVTPAPVPNLALSGVAGQAGQMAGQWRDNAFALLGTPYVYGGNSRRGIDCSAFVLQVFTPLGVKLPRVSAEQARAGVAVAASALQPGDLVFFDTEGGGRVTHVGIYLGNDTFINANSYKGQVAVDHLSERYWATRYLSARRVLPDMMASN